MDTQNKIPPQNIDAETSLLGAILIDSDAIVKIADIIVPDDFYRTKSCTKTQNLGKREVTRGGCDWRRLVNGAGVSIAGFCWR